MVLPAPLTPTTASLSPRWRFRQTSRKTCLSSKDLLTFSSSRISRPEPWQAEKKSGWCARSRTAPAAPVYPAA
ncbi:hypothetical protein H206_06240 [Candidatus Electrothrix aarhusensis]|uniref:Uncharacterized protein n=1 Tax=Candidatus Electrothrix aarhusensis TaxID=1859131 RepID=A0A444J351_9BACT|nr:hypothetical protein H206_06240 [Candidatus Electrothrix aarhusensis]